MKTAIDKITKELQEKVSKDIDEHLVVRIIELFHEGVLELTQTKPKCTAMPDWRNEKFRQMEEAFKVMRGALEFYGEHENWMQDEFGNYVVSGTSDWDPLLRHKFEAGKIARAALANEAVKRVLK